MDAEAAGAAVSKPGSTLCGAPLVKVVVLSSLVGSFSLLGALVGLHFSGHLGSSQGQRAEATSAGAMVSGANSVNQPGQKKGSTTSNAVAAAALADSDAADALDEAIQNVADVIDKAAADADLPDGPSMNTDLDIGGGLGGDSLSDSAGDALSNLADSSEGLEGDSSMEDLSDRMAAGGLSDALGDSAEGLGDLGGGFGDSSDSMEILGGDGLAGFGDGMGDFGEGFGDVSDGLGAGMVMSAMMNNNNNDVNRPRQGASQQQQNVNPLGILVLTDGMDFKKR